MASCDTRSAARCTTILLLVRWPMPLHCLRACACRSGCGVSGGDTGDAKQQRAGSGQKPAVASDGKAAGRTSGSNDQHSAAGNSAHDRNLSWLVRVAGWLGRPYL
jgi:hypothetical protein